MKIREWFWLVLLLVLILIVGTFDREAYEVSANIQRDYWRGR